MKVRIDRYQASREAHLFRWGFVDKSRLLPFFSGLYMGEAGGNKNMEPQHFQQGDLQEAA